MAAANPLPMEPPAEQEVQDLWLEEIRLQDIGIFNEFSIRPGQVTKIIGPNRQGKSTVRKTLRALHHEHNPDLIQQGKKKGEVNFYYTDGSRSRIVIQEKSSERVFYSSDGRVVRSGARAELESLGTHWALEPMNLVSEDKDKRKKFLQTVLPLAFTRNELKARTGETISVEQYDLEAFDQFVEGLRERRKDQGKKVKNEEAVLADNERDIPAREETDWMAQARQFGEEEANYLRALDAAVSDHKSTFSKAEHNARLALQKKIADIQAEAQRQIGLANQDIENRIQELRKTRDQAITDEQTVATAKIQEARDAKVSAETKARQQQQMEGVRRMIEQSRARIKGLSVELNRLDLAVKDCEVLRNQKLAEMSIKDVEIIGSQIYWHHEGKRLDFDTQLSTSEQIEVAMKISGRGTGKLRVFFIDQAEAIDNKNERALVHKAKEYGYQVILFAVDSSVDKLTVVNLE